ncbi:hypothetical protein ES705_24984 [subsurface metagenome]
MDTSVLISEVAQLHNQAATSRNQGQEGEARAYLENLRDLLNNELPAETPAEPKTPAEPSEG